MRKIYKILIFVLLGLLIQKDFYGQITIRNFPTGATFTRGSSVSVWMNSTYPFKITNKFTLELSNESGSFANPTILNVVRKHFTPFINAAIPLTGITDGSGYRLRVVSIDTAKPSSASIVSDTTPSFSITSAGAIVSTSFSSSEQVSIKCIDTIFGTTVASKGASIVGINFFFTVNDDRLNPNYTYETWEEDNTTNKFNLIDNVVFNSNQNQFSANINGNGFNTYCVRIKSNLGGFVVAERRFLIINTTNNTNLSNLSSETLCLPDSAKYFIDTTKTNGIGTNYPSARYKLSWGDGSDTLLTHYQLLANPYISHGYITPSCSQTQTNGIFKVTEVLYVSENKCSNGTDSLNKVEKGPRVFLQPSARFSGPDSACKKSQVLFKNISKSGSFNTSGSGCIDSSYFNWYYQPPGKTSWFSGPYGFKLDPNFPDYPNYNYGAFGQTNDIGIHRIKLKAKVKDDGASSCAGTEYIDSICIEEAPNPKFAFYNKSTNDSITVICKDTIVILKNFSNTMTAPCTYAKYVWTITGVGGSFSFVDGTSPTDAEPHVKFRISGNYTICLQITNSCGTSTPYCRTLRVIQDPTVTLLSDTTKICVDSANHIIDFAYGIAINSTGPPVLPPASYTDPTIKGNITYDSGNALSISGFTWIIEGYNGSVVTSSDYTFIKGSGSNSQYPTIKFNSFKSYRIIVGINRACSPTSLGLIYDTMYFDLKQKPQINITPAQSNICKNESKELAINYKTGTATLPTQQNWYLASVSSGSLGNGITYTSASPPRVDYLNTYYAVGESSNGCTDTATAAIFQLPKLKTDTVFYQYLCVGSYNSIPLSYTPSSSLTNGVNGEIRWYATNSTAVGLPASSGKGDKIVFTATNTTKDTIVSIVKVVSVSFNTDLECAGDTLLFKIVVLPNINVDTILDNKTVCAGDSILPVPLKSDAIKSTYSTIAYRWNFIPIPANDIGQKSPYTGDTIQGFTTKNTTNVPIADTVKITPSYTYKLLGSSIKTCDGNLKSYAITVNPTPKITNTNLTDTLFCNNFNVDSIPLTSTTSLVNTTFSWSKKRGSLVTGLSGVNGLPKFTTVNTTKAPIIDTITVTPTYTNNGVSCNGPIKTFRLITLPTVIAQKIDTISVCAKQTVPSITPKVDTNAFPAGASVLYSWVSSNKSIGLRDSTASVIPSFVAIDTSTVTVPDTIKSIVTVTPLYTFIDVAPGSGKSKTCAGNPVNYTINVLLKPTAKFEWDTGDSCAHQSGTLKNIINKSKYYPGKVTWKWRVVNDSALTNKTVTGVIISDSTVEKPNFKFPDNQGYKDSGYTVTLIVTSTDGCGDTTKQSMLIKRRPLVRFGVDNDSICGGNVQVIDTTDNIAHTSFWFWSSPTVVAIAPIFEPNPSSNPSNAPVIKFQVNTTESVIRYDIKQVATRLQSDCKDSLVRSVWVFPKPEASFNYNKLDSCSTWTVTLSNTSKAKNGDAQNTLATKWIITPCSESGTPGSSYTINNVLQPTVTFTNTGTKDSIYAVKLIVTTQYGCADTSTVDSFRVHPTPKIYDTVVRVCSNKRLELKPQHGLNGAIVPDSIRYTWRVIDNFNLEGYNNSNDLKKEISDTVRNKRNVVDTLIYRVSPSLKGACVGDSFNLRAIIYPVPEIKDTTIAICSGGNFTLNVSGASPNIVPAGTQYTWTFINGAAITGKASQSTRQLNIQGTLINTSNVIDTVVYRVVPVSGADVSCAGNTFTLKVAVYPKPFVKDTSFTICSRDTLVFTPQNAVNTNIIPNPTKYTWRVSQPNSNIVGAGNNPTPSLHFTDTLLNTSNTNQIVIYKVLPVSELAGPCVGDSFEVKVTVKPRPFITKIDTTTICSGNLFKLVPKNGVNGNIVPDGTQYKWNLLSQPDITDTVHVTNYSDTIKGALFNSVNSPKTAEYKVVARSLSMGACISDSFDVKVTINPTPKIADITMRICSGDSFAIKLSDSTRPGDIVPNGTIYKWSYTDRLGVTGESAELTGNSVIRDTLTNNNNVVDTVVYKVVAVSGVAGSCESAPFELKVIINPTPKIHDTDYVICSGTSFKFKPAISSGWNIVPAGTKFKWALVDNPQIKYDSSETTLQDSVSIKLVNTTDSIQYVTYNVVPSVNGQCLGNPFKIKVQVNPTPEIRARELTICSRDEFILPLKTNDTTLVPAGTKYKWISTPNINVFGDSTENVLKDTVRARLYNLRNIVDTVNYKVIPVSGLAGSCVGDTFSLRVIINPKPEIKDSTITICSDSSFKINPIDFAGWNIVPANTKYKWTVDANNNVEGESDRLSEIYFITDTLKNKTDTVQKIIYHVVPISGVTGNCVGDTFKLTVLLNPSPFIKDTSAIICSDSFFVIKPVNGVNGNIVPLGIKYKWVVSGLNAKIQGAADQIIPQEEIRGTLFNTSDTVQKIEYTVTPVVGGLCPGGTFKVTVTINPIPKITKRRDTICSGEEFMILPKTDDTTIIPKGTKYKWTLVSNKVNIVGDSSESNLKDTIKAKLFNTSNKVDTVWYKVFPVSGDAGNCEGKAFEVMVIVAPRPKIGLQVTQICSNTEFKVSPKNGGDTIVPIGTKYAWKVVANVDVEGDRDSSNYIDTVRGKLRNKHNRLDSVFYKVSPKSGDLLGCVGDSFTVKVYVSPVPELRTFYDTICSKDSFRVVPANRGDTIVPENTKYEWRVIDNVKVEGDRDSSNSVNRSDKITGKLENKSSIGQDVEYRVSPKVDGGCVGDSFIVKIHVKPRPVIRDSIMNICSGDSVVIGFKDGLLGDIVPEGTKYVWSVTDNDKVLGDRDSTNAWSDSIRARLTNTTNVAKTVVYRVVAKSDKLGGCESDTINITVNINPTPEISTKITSTCSNTPFSIKPVNVIGGDIVPDGTTYTWNVIQNINISGQEQVTALRDSISDTLRNKTNKQDTLYYRVEPSVGGKCKGDSFTVKVAINPTPEIGLHADTICNNGTFTVIPVNNQPTTIVPDPTTYTWTFTDNPNVNGEQNQSTGVGNISGTLQNITQVSQVVQYTVTPKSGDVGNCVGNSFNVNVVVRPDAKSEFTTDTTIACAPFIIKNHLNVIRYTEANDETQYKWFADDSLIGIGSTVPDYSITKPADTVVIKLIAKSAYGCKDDTSSITLYTVQKPIPGFTKSTDSVCGPYKIYFKNTTTPINVINGSKYEWDFGNDSISNSPQPDSILYQPDNVNFKDTTYYITLKVMTVCDTLLYKDSVLIKSLPKSLFQPDVTVACSSIPVGFRNISKGSKPVEYIWDWDDGSRDTTFSPPQTARDSVRISHTFITPITDTFGVKLYAKNVCGIDSSIVPILVFANKVFPQIIVSGPDVYGCAPHEITMTNNSTGGTKYIIDFGDGTSYTTTKDYEVIKHTYLYPDKFVIKMRGISEVCFDTTTTDTVTIYPTPVASFKTDSTEYCQKDSVRITNLSTYDADIQYSWDFGDGTTLITSNINPPPHKYAMPNTYIIKLKVIKTNSSGYICEKDTSIQVKINPSPVADFTTNSGAFNCAPFTFIGTTNSPDYTTVNWYFLNNSGVEILDGKRSGLNINYTISQPGLYKVKMVAFNSFGCTDTIIKSLKVEETPKAGFTVPDTVYCGLSANVTFSNATTYSGTDVVDYEWLVDGALKSATSTQFTYTFASPPNTTDPIYFKVRLIAKASISGCNDYFEKTITLLPLPQPKLTAFPDSGCSPLTVNLTNNSKYADAYQWKLNGVLFSTNANPAPVVLPASGTTYIFELIADNTKGGCGPVSAFDTVRTLPTPTALFKLNNSTDDTIKYCKSQTIKINDNSYINAIGNKAGLVYQWYINDVLQLTTFANPVFQLTNNSYTNDELFEIKLIVTSASGCKDTLSKYVLLYPKPKANFILNGGNSDCAMPLHGLVKTVDNLSQVKTPETYSWNVYNRTSASPIDGVLISNNIAASPIFSFPDNHTASDTTYDIRLIVNSVNGCADTTTNTQIVYARPMVSYRVSDTVSCKGNLRVTFYDMSVSPTSTITDRLWSFDDGIEGKTASITHDYNLHGLYYPSLFVKNANGCFSDTLRKRIKIFGAPNAAFLTPASVCMGTDLNPINNSTLGWGSVAFSNILWDFGDGKTSNVLSPIHQYTAPGNYTVTLSISSDSSCVASSKTATIAVTGKPTADFSYSSLCAGKPILFINNSTKGYGDKGFNLVRWEFGDASSSSLFNAQHTFNSPNNYDVQMIVEGLNCPQLKDTMLKRLDIKLVSRPDSIYPVIYATKGEELTLMAANDGVSYLWSPSTGLSNPTQQVTNALYLSAIPNKINYNILISDSSGCEINDQQEVWVFEKPEVYAPTAFTPNGDGANDVFIPFYVNIKSLQSFRIFNRWGEKIFDTNDLTKGWDGILASGLKAPLESYSWVVECFDVNGIKLIRKGIVTLIRN